MGSASARPARGRIAYGPLFHHRDFVALWLGQTISFIGDYFYWLAIPIMVERLTGSTFMVGLSLISTALPMLFLGPVAGVFVDRWDRKRMMIAADVLRSILVLLCLVVRTPEQVWIYFVAGFLMSCVSQFFFPAQNAVLPLIVPDKDELLAANGLMQVVQTVGLLAGPAMAGFSIGLWGERVAFVADSASYLASAAAIATMRVPHTTAGRQAAGGQLAAVAGELREGLAFLFGSSVMLGVLICLSVVQLGVGAMNVLWVPFLQRTFGIGAEGLGIVDSAQGAGMVMGGIALGFVLSRIKKTVMASYGILLIGLLWGSTGLAPSFGYVIAVSFGVGLALIPVQSALTTVMQLAVPDPKRGRVGSALNAFGTLTGLVSMAGAAAFGEMVGLRTVYVIAGLIVMLGGLIGLRVLTEPEAPVDGRPEGARLEIAESPGD